MKQLPQNRSENASRHPESRPFKAIISLRVNEFRLVNSNLLFSVDAVGDDKGENAKDKGGSAAIASEPGLSTARVEFVLCVDR